MFVPSAELHNSGWGVNLKLMALVVNELWPYKCLPIVAAGYDEQRGS